MKANTQQLLNAAVELEDIEARIRNWEKNKERKRARAEKYGKLEQFEAFAKTQEELYEKREEYKKILEGQKKVFV